MRPTATSGPGQTISLCMIVRNEERSIGRCLAGIRDFVDEMIVVDTGSDDATPEIARRFGAALFNLPWPGSFSEARNHSIARASGKWILVLDADETLASRDALRLRELVERTGAWGFKLIQRTYLWNANVVCAVPNPRDYEEGREYSNCIDVGVIRLFRNAEQIRYRGRVHELVEPVFEEEGLPCETTGLVVHHFGKVGDPARLETKKRLYLDLGIRKAGEDSGDSLAQFELGVQLYELGRHAECIPYFKNALRLNPAADLALLYIAKAYHQSGMMDRAERFYQKCLARAPADDKVLFEYANFVRDGGNFKSALKLYARTLEINSGHSLALFNTGVTHVRLGAPEASLDWFDRAIRLNPDNESFYENLARLPLNGHCLGQAAIWIAAYLDHFPRSAAGHSALGDVSFRLKRFEQALASSSRALELEPDRPGNLLVKANSQFALGRLLEAEETYRSVLKLADGNLDSMMNLASIAEHRGDYIAAKSWYRRIIQLYPEHAQALKRYMRAQIKSGLDEGAGPILEKAYSANPDDLECLLLVGALLERAGDLDAARALYTRAARDRPDWAGIAEQKLRRLAADYADDPKSA